MPVNAYPAVGSGEQAYQTAQATQGMGPPLTFQPPAGAVLIDRYDDGSRWAQFGPDTLNTGLPPVRIPRLWNPSLGALSGLVQYGWPDAFSELRLSPPIIVPNTRAAPSNVQQQWQGQPADTLGVPAFFVGQ